MKAIDMPNEEYNQYKIRKEKRTKEHKEIDVYIEKGISNKELTDLGFNKGRIQYRRKVVRKKNNSLGTKCFDLMIVEEMENLKSLPEVISKLKLVGEKMNVLFPVRHIKRFYNNNLDKKGKRTSTEILGHKQIDYDIDEMKYGTALPQFKWEDLSKLEQSLASK